jgi:hypothetical protein
MSCRSKFRYIAAIWLSCEMLGLAPALADECGVYGCGDGYVVQQTGGYAAVLTRYCDGYGGGQWPFEKCSVGVFDQTHPTPARVFAVVKARPPLPGALPIVTKYKKPMPTK